MAKAREIPGLERDIPYAEAAARVVEVRTAELIEHSAEVLDTEEIEPLHDMRVASRRLRAALEVFAPCFPRKQHKRALREVKALADALGERRDRDVAIVALERFAGSIAAPDRPGIGSLVGGFRAEQALANEELEPVVDRARLDALRERLDGLARAAREAARGAEAEAEPPRQAPVTRAGEGHDSRGPGAAARSQPGDSNGTGA